MIGLILKSRQFWTLLIDFMVKAIALLVNRFSPENAALFHEIWVMAQPLVMLVVVLLTVQDTAGMIVNYNGATRAISHDKHERARSLIASVWKW